MSEFLRLITLQDANTRVVLLGVAVLGLACGVVGSFAVLRRRALVGDAVAHASLPGVCVAYFIVGDRQFWAFLAGALVFGLLAVLCITQIRRWTRIKEDAAIGVVLSVFFGLGIMLSTMVQKQPGGNRAGLDSFLFGKAAGMVRQDVVLIVALALVVLSAVVLGFKEWKLLCFDREFGASIGRRVYLLDLALMALICICTVIGLPAVGVVLVVALLVIPAAGARFWTNRLGVMLAVAGAAGAISGVAGACVSALQSRVPAGPAIALAAGVFFGVSLLFAPGRGVIAGALRRASLQRRIMIENLLRALHELGERNAASGGANLSLARIWSPVQLDRAVRLARRRGLVEVREGSPVLTPDGASRAAEIVRAHRLWELYLIEHAAIEPDHVDRDADAIEHLLPPEVLAGLEQRLAAQGRLPHVPGSPHPLGAATTGGAA